MEMQTHVYIGIIGTSGTICMGPRDYRDREGARGSGNTWLVQGTRGWWLVQGTRGTCELRRVVTPVSIQIELSQPVD